MFTSSLSRRFVGVSLVFSLSVLVVACEKPEETSLPRETASVSAVAPNQPGSSTSNSVSKAAALITVPDVSGMNHQQAQDTMQAAGLYNLREVDGKGLKRLLIIDRNWIQTGQDPAAGSKVSPDTVITLTAVKNGEKP